MGMNDGGCYGNTVLGGVQSTTMPKWLLFTSQNCTDSLIGHMTSSTRLMVDVGALLPQVEI